MQTQVWWLKCGKCHSGGTNMPLKEERIHLIDKNITYVEEEKKWEAGYPWIKDPDDLPHNRCAALAKLKSTEKRLLKDQNYAQIHKQQTDDKFSWGVAGKLNFK